jgi:predicted phage baseplate assembly protein
MTSLAPNLFDERFDDLMKIGRARLRALAPDWTDYNAHDPGITLMELLAWTSEAQMYSLARMRRDERAAYAAFLGIKTGGTRGATGIIWSDPADPNSPLATFLGTMVLSPDTVINLAGTPAPTFRPQDKLLWVPGRIRSLQSRTARGRTTDLTASNDRRGLTFLPFGDRAGPGAVFAIDYVCNDPGGLFGADRKAAKDALWAIGILAAPPLTGPTSDPVQATPAGSPSIAATLVDGDSRYAVRVVRDSTQGLLGSGAVMLDLSGVPTSPEEFTIELRSPRGFARPPRWLRVEPSVIPVLQGRVVSNELNYSIATPNWSFKLANPGVRFEAGEQPVVVAIVDRDTGLEMPWQRVDHLVDHGPSETVFEYDASTRQVTFGNGLNGQLVPDQAQVLASYAVSDAEQGNVGRNRKWQVAGFQGVMGINLDPVGGGASAPDWVEQRRDARERSKTEHALVSSDDIVAAAKGLPLLEVARAWISTPANGAPRTGVVTLVAMRARTGPNEPAQAPETSRWLDAIRRRLTPQMPLGARLMVVAPTYVPFSLTASIECVRGVAPDDIKTAVEQTLSERLTLVAASAGARERDRGVVVTLRDVTIWIRSTPGVARVTALTLLDETGKALPNGVSVPTDGFPKWLFGASTVSVTRQSSGGAR